MLVWNISMMTRYVMITMFFCDVGSWSDVSMYVCIVGKRSASVIKFTIRPINCQEAASSTTLHIPCHHTYVIRTYINTYINKWAYIYFDPNMILCTQIVHTSKHMMSMRLAWDRNIYTLIFRCKWGFFAHFWWTRNVWAFEWLDRVFFTLLSIMLLIEHLSFFRMMGLEQIQHVWPQQFIRLKKKDGMQGKVSH